MSYHVHICKVLQKKEIAPKIVEMQIQNEALAKEAKPGQFLHIKCGDSTSMPLRRPISICDVTGDVIRFIFEVKGRGTQALFASTDEQLDVLGPVGNGFTVDGARYQKPAVIGGGIGVYPLYFLTKQLQNANVYLGFRNQSLVTLEEDFNHVAKGVFVATDDGSYGHHGFALDLLKRDYEKEAFDVLYACGPKGMLKAIKAFAEEAGIPCQISLEERMGCGIGACLTCTCKSSGGDNVRVCRNGPVFWTEEVEL